jgi:hypothetical protein
MQQPLGSAAPFPPDLYAFATTHNLGVPLKEYRWGFSCLELVWMPFAGFWLL